MTTRPANKHPQKKRFLFLLAAAALAILLTPARVFAYGDFSEQPNAREGQSFFLLSNAVITDCDSNILCVKSGVSASNLSAGAYVIFSELELFGDISGQVNALFSKITVHTQDESEPDFVRGFFGLPALGQWARVDGNWVYNSVPPGWALALMGRALRLALILGAAALKKGFFAQGSAFLRKRPLKTMRNGLLFSFGAAAVASVFLLSAAGIPLALLAALILIGLTLAGEASLGLAVWKTLLPKIMPKYSAKKNQGMYAKIAIGVIIIEITRLIPLFVHFADWLLLPVLCSGAVVTALYEGYVKKVFVLETRN